MIPIDDFTIEVIDITGTNQYGNSEVSALCHNLFAIIHIQEWPNVTHIPCGKVMLEACSISAAMELIEQLEALDVDWSTAETVMRRSEHEQRQIR